MVPKEHLRGMADELMGLLDGANRPIPGEQKDQSTVL